MNKFYREKMAELNPILEAAHSAAKNNSRAPFEALHQHILSAAGRNVNKKEALENTIDLLVSRGGAEGKAIADSFRKIQVNYAAAALSPALKKGILSQSAVVGAGAAMMTGNPMVAGGLAAGAAISSPRLAKTAVQTALKTKAFISKLPQKQLNELLSNPQAFQALGNTMLGAPAVHNQVTNQLMQQALPAIMGGQR
jgi:hypothetical protein